ncbi:MAG: WYL domain-containing protein [Clostridia bacterium]|nr:WYL domain-containing protein [Clostridia bacterium]
MSDLARTERLLNLLYTVQKQPGIQAKELAKIFGRSTRTIQRDILDLRKLGFELASSTGAAGGFASRGSYYLKPLTFSGAEAMALFVASRVLLEQKGFPYRDDLQAALDKIANVIRENDEGFFRGLEPKTSLLVKQLKDYYPWGQVFIDLNQAILGQYTLRMTYDSYSGGAVSERMVDPYHMMFREGCWYLVGYCHNRQEARIFRVDRIRNLARTSQKFELPEDFSLREYMENSWQLGKGDPVLVKVQFDPPVSRLIRESTWHHTQEIQELPGDRLIFSARVEGTWEIKKWILGWGQGAICLEPQELREEIARELMEMVRKYGEEKEASHGLPGIDPL